MLLTIDNLMLLRYKQTIVILFTTKQIKYSCVEQREFITVKITRKKKKSL